MSKKLPARKIALLLVCGLLSISALIFLLGAGLSLSRKVLWFALLLLGTGFANLWGASTVPAAGAATEWQMIQGLLDVMMAIMLFMSSNTRIPALLLVIMSIWALMGALARMLSTLKLKGAARNRGWLHTGAMLMGSMLFLCGALVPTVNPTLCIGIGMLFCVAANAWFERSTKHG